MFNRPLHRQPFSLPDGLTLPDQPAEPFENVYHTPGEAAAIRFFDPSSEQDLEAMRDILKGKQSRKWMDDPRISQSAYRDWAGTQSDTSFLFAVLDARLTDPEEMSRVRGFVYIYSEREEKFRVKRMERQGFLEPPTKPRYALEASFAVRPQGEGIQSGSGLMSSSLRQCCLQVQMLLESPERAPTELFAFTHPDNSPAQRTLEACGFIKQGSMLYDWDSPEPTWLYILDWPILENKVRDKVVKSIQRSANG